MGGREDDDRSKKIKIPTSSAIVRAIAEQTIKWTDEPEFGYEVAEDLPGIDDVELLQPWRLYERQSRTDEYKGFVERFRGERREVLAGFPQLSDDIVKAIG